MIYLYVKTHKITGLKYFGKTTRKDPISYTGSGKYWKNHIKKYGKHFDTEILASFEDIKECEKFALKFSEENNIVNSNEWANLKEENGLDGNPKGIKFSEEHKDKIRKSRIGKCYNDFDDETRLKMSRASKLKVEKMLSENNHPWQGKKGSEFAKERNAKLIQENKHNFQGKKGSILSKKNNKQMIKNGTHPFMKKSDGSSLSSQRVKDGTHPFLQNKGTVSVVDKNGNSIRISKELFWNQTGTNTEKEYVGITSKEAKIRLKTAKEK